MLRKHGLIGPHVFSGKQGVMDYIRQTGCIQFDPVDVCGKNAELVLQSRVKGFTKDMLHELLYEDRLLIDYTDKNQSILPIEDWPNFARYREAGRKNARDFPDMEPLFGKTREHIKANGPVNSDELSLEGEFKWWSAIHWSAGSKTSRIILEQMYTTGDLVIHHKKGTRKYYDLAEKHIPKSLREAPEPLPDEFEYQKWRMLRRIGAVGLLWDRPSDAWLHIQGLDPSIRKNAFKSLLAEGRITETSVEGINHVLYARSEDKPLIEETLKDKELKHRCELFAPLDCIMWDRKLIQALFGFHYAWEIYTPAEKRKYGYYTLPLVYGENYIGRIDPVVDRKTKTLNINNIWYEEKLKQTKTIQKAVDNCIERFAAFNGCEIIDKS
jgi:hypothetical protein